MLKLVRKIEKFFVNIGYISILLVGPGSYRYKKPRTEKFFDSPKPIYLNPPKVKEYGHRIFLFIAGLIISIFLIGVVVSFLLSLLS